MATTTVSLVGPCGEPIPAGILSAGSGRTVVFLHGLVGLNEHWEDVVRQVMDRFRCLTLELPLLDLSGSDCSIHGVAEVTTRFLEGHVREPAVLVGNSFGGHVALRIAHRRPELVQALVLAGSSGLYEKTFVRGAPVRPSREWLEQRIAELFYDRANMRPADVDRAHAALSTRSGARAMVRLSKTARRDNLEREIGEITQPTLLIWGREDVVTPPSAARGFLERLPDARIVWLDRCGHAPMIEAPDAFADALRRFADELDERDAAAK